MIEGRREESDQLPEEGPAEQVPDDAGGVTREKERRNPGVPGEEERPPPATPTRRVPGRPATRSSRRVISER